MPAANLIGGAQAQGFKQIMTGLESERLNVAARGVGLARAAFEDAIRYAQQRHTFGKPICEHQTIQIKLADMATKIEAARLLVYSAAEKKDRGERCDLEAGMAKLFATETAQEVALEALRVHGGAGYSKDLQRRTLLSRRAATDRRRRHQRAAAADHRQGPDRPLPAEVEPNEEPFTRFATRP